MGNAESVKQKTTEDRVLIKFEMVQWMYKIMVAKYPKYLKVSPNETLEMSCFYSQVSALLLFIMDNVQWVKAVLKLI